MCMYMYIHLRGSALKLRIFEKLRQLSFERDQIAGLDFGIRGCFSRQNKYLHVYIGIH